MIKNTPIIDFISFLPMPALIIDSNGFIVNANIIYREKFKIFLGFKNQYKKILYQESENKYTKFLFQY